MTITAKLVRIGNSRGIRLPKAALVQSKLGEVVELEVGLRRITIRPHKPVNARAGWDEAFAQMAARGEDRLPEMTWPQTDWDKTEWTW